MAVAATLDRGPYILVNTVVMGGMLALVSMGLAMVFGVMNIPMFAHGQILIGTLVAYNVFTPLNAVLHHPSGQPAEVRWGPLATIVVAMVGALAGVASEVLVFSQRRNQPRELGDELLLLTVGLSVVWINGHQLFFGADFKGIVRFWNGAPYSILGVFISRDRAMAFFLAAVVVLAFWLFISYTRTGRAIRAVSQDETGALIVGIGLNAILMLTMAISCALAAVAGEPFVHVPLNLSWVWSRCTWPGSW